MKKTNSKMYNLVAVAVTVLLCSCSQPAGLEQQQIDKEKAPLASQSTQGSSTTDTMAAAPLMEMTLPQERAADSVLTAGSATPAPQPTRLAAKQMAGTVMSDASSMMMLPPPPSYNTESYNNLSENRFILTANDPLSTFSIDVDTASYANVRRMLNQNMLPSPGSIRLEEMINYFQYDYAVEPRQDISITTEVGPAPWRKNAKLVRIGLAARDIPDTSLPPSNLVFLIDVSGSMAHPNKLPLLQQSMHMLVDSLGQNDRIAIVVYAGSDRVVLTPTSGSQKKTIHTAIDSLAAGGSTHASSGITTAYELARQNLVQGGNNRIILASDGDFNVGVTSRDELEKLVAGERESGVFLTVLGFGIGNYHDDTMEVLADKGNGNYAYIDSLLEARKVLVQEKVANLFTLARDVKLQVEFNPAKVAAYRLLGYENRQLADEDFRDDQKDAGEIGIGHRVTALYELLAPGSSDLPQVDSLKYQKVVPSQATDELLTVKVRYKPQDQLGVRELSATATDQHNELTQTSNDFRFAASVAGFGMILANSANHGTMTLAQVKELAVGSKGKDEEGYRAEFVRLVETAQLLQNYKMSK